MLKLGCPAGLLGLSAQDGERDQNDQPEYSKETIRALLRLPVSQSGQRPRRCVTWVFLHHACEWCKVVAEEPRQALFSIPLKLSVFNSQFGQNRPRWQPSTGNEVLSRENPLKTNGCLRMCRSETQPRQTMHAAKKRVTAVIVLSGNGLRA